jgi:hypothetical protein
MTKAKLVSSFDHHNPPGRARQAEPYVKDNSPAWHQDLSPWQSMKHWTSTFDRSM